MNYDEEYWRAKAVEAQSVAESYYAAAMVNREFGIPSVARSWQAEAYDAHQKAMARLGWAEVERNNTRGKYKVLLIDHVPGAHRAATDVLNWSLNRRGTQ